MSPQMLRYLEFIFFPAGPTSTRIPEIRCTRKKFGLALAHCEHW